MNHNPFNEYTRPSEYHLSKDDERQRVDSVAKRIASITRPRNKSRRIWYLSLAASVLLVSAFWFFSQPDPEQLAQSFFKPYQNYGAQQLRGERPADQLINFYKAYDAGQYVQAIGTYLESTETKRPLDKFYYAIALIGLADYSAGMEMLSSLEGQLPAEHLESLRFYTGLAWVGMGQMEKAQIIFNEIIKQPTSYYFQDAQRIVNKIK
jgi:tetratricopeptide (TPR) repeat protein